MRSGVLTALVLALATVFSASTTAASKPSVALVDRSPVVVRGAGFAPAERVSVVLAAGTRSTRRVVANADGRFTATFSRSLARCARYSVQAFGSQGSRARQTPTLATPDCLPGND